MTLIITKRSALRTALIAVFFWAAIYLVSQVIGYFQYKGETTDYYLQDIQQDYISTPFTLSFESPIRDSLENNYNLEKFQRDFIRAQSYLHQSQQLHQNVGLDKYYTDSVIQKIVTDVDTHSELESEVSSLNHQLHLHLLSTDHKVIVVTDSNQVSYSHLSHGGETISKSIDSAIVRYVLLMEEGHWRVHKKKTLYKKSTNIDSLPLVHKITVSQKHIKKVRGINYYPRSAPWTQMWPEYSQDTTHRDLEIIKSLGFNTIRIFIPYFDYREKETKNTILSNAKNFLELCHLENLKVMVTLFDFYEGVETYRWGNQMQYLDTVVHHLSALPALHSWDLKNEADLDFKHYSKEAVMDWSKFFSYYLKKQDSLHPVSMGWSASPKEDMLLRHHDFTNFHGYTTALKLKKQIAHLKSASQKAILISEVGRSTYHGLWLPWGYNESSRSRFYKNLNTIRALTDVPFMVWTLHDFDSLPEGVFPSKPWIQNVQKRFGIVQNHTLTSSAKTLRDDTRFESVKREYRLNRNWITKIFFSLAVLFILSLLYTNLKSRS